MTGGKERALRRKKIEGQGKRTDETEREKRYKKAGHRR